ncbi:MAG TPA: glycoside hydrolase family 30 protein [Vicinamibacteria bacterium]|nr:glycoside hydrolase family 30 protein [Vicinamibacteria bacterium]
MTTINRRQFLGRSGVAAAAAALPRRAAPSQAGPAPGATWISTSQREPWRSLQGVEIGALAPNPFEVHLEVKLDQPKQAIEGFGGAFGEKGWLALERLPARDRGAVLDALFKAGAGTGFTVCRTPIAANDIARGWYSYDEQDGDFALERFSVANDRETLIPYIRAALERQPRLEVWASPWSPPTWMKTNRHYAMVPAWPGQPANGLKEEQRGREGQDSFIQEDRYFTAYAAYFRRYVEEYGQAGIRIAMVMPQNEFNSAQPFPSCCWTPEGLARFLPHLGREMARVSVEIFFGTLERPNADLLTKVLADPSAGPLVKGVGIQWAGKGALARIHERHPDLRIWASEQECGLGTNDWRYARYCWSLMKQYFLSNASAWMYWNMVMPNGGLSGWGWPQNSLVSVDTEAGTYRLNHEYWLLRHLSQFVQVGARRLPTESFFGYDNLLAFRNPDGQVVLVLQNDLSDPLRIQMRLGARQVAVTLPPDTFNTVVIDGAALEAAAP